MVVCVKPFGHFQGRNIALHIAACKAEIPIQQRIIQAGRKAWRNSSQHAGNVQHSIVQGKIAGSHIIKTGLFLHFPVAFFQFCTGFKEGFGGNAAFPEGF